MGNHQLEEKLKRSPFVAQVTTAACSALALLAKDANARSNIRQAGAVVLLLPFLRTGVSQAARAFFLLWRDVHDCHLNLQAGPRM